MNYLIIIYLEITRLYIRYLFGSRSREKMVQAPLYDYVHMVSSLSFLTLRAL